MFAFSLGYFVPETNSVKGYSTLPIIHMIAQGSQRCFCSHFFWPSHSPFFVDQMSCNQCPPLSKHVAIKYHPTSLCKINTLCKLIQILLLPSVFQYSRRGRIEGECWNYKRMLFSLVLCPGFSEIPLLNNVISGRLLLFILLSPLFSASSGSLWATHASTSYIYP